MRPKPFIAGPFLLAIAVTALSITLVSWDARQTPFHSTDGTKVTDTVPKEKKIVNLDDVLDQLDAAEMKIDMENVQQKIADAMKKVQEVDMVKAKMEMDEAMKKFDAEKIKEETEEALAQVNWDKIKEEMKDFDAEKIKAETEKAIAQVNWDKIKEEMDRAKTMDWDKVQEQMKKAQKQMEEIGPKVKMEMDKAKVQIEKAKAEMNEYKSFIDGLDKDGLINKKEEYTIKHKDGELTINGKKVSPEIYSKYHDFLENHKAFTIEKTKDNFNINTDKNVE